MNEGFAPGYSDTISVTNSCRGYSGYKNYKPYEIKVLKRIQRMGWRKGRLGSFRWGILLAPFFIQGWYQYMWYLAVMRRNRQYLFDTYRDLSNKLHPLYKHEEEKSKFAIENKLRRQQRIAQMEIGDPYDYDDIRVYHFPRRHPELTITPQMSPLHNC